VASSMAGARSISNSDMLEISPRSSKSEFEGPFQSVLRIGTLFIPIPYQNKLGIEYSYL
jgi:hypothetical protein